MYRIQGEAVFDGTGECFALLGALGALWALAAFVFYVLFW